MNPSLLSLPLLAVEAHTATQPHVPTWQTALFGLILVAVLALLATEKLHKTIVVLLGAGICLFLGQAFGYFPPAPPGHHVPVYISMIEWEVIGIVIGATVFVEIAARSGVFTYASVRMLKASGGDPFRLLVFFSVLTAIFSAFLDNITAMIIIGSLTVVACRKLNFDPKPFLITEAVMTNVGGLLTLISSLPNIIIGKTAGISYLTFLIVSTPYTVLTIAASLYVARRVFGASVAPLTDPALKARNQHRVNTFDEWETVNDRQFFQVSIAAVILVILGFALKNQIPVLRHFGIEFVALGAAVLMMLLYGRNVGKSLSHVDWPLVFFFAGLFIVIGVMDAAQVLLAIGDLLETLTGNRYIGNVVLMWLTAIFSSVTDNIPLAAMLARIFGPNPEAVAAVPMARWWAIVFGANLGGNITPIASASTVVAVTIMKKHKLRVGFVEFVKIGAIFAAVQLALASGYILLLQLIYRAL